MKNNCMFKSALVHWYLNDGPCLRASGATASVFRNKQLRSTLAGTLCFVAVPYCSLSVKMWYFTRDQNASGSPIPSIVSFHRDEDNDEYLSLFCPLSFSFPRSLCLIFSGSIIYSDSAPQAKVGGIKKDLCTLA